MKKNHSTKKVILISRGYEWKCPKCGVINEVDIDADDWVDEVECCNCETIFKTEPNL